jgi:NhaP-type Na+/H+ or K+/H+ antiporter
MTVIAAYGTYFIAEAPAFGASGVLAVVTLGLVMSSQSHTAFSPESYHLLHEVWELLGLWANTLIFVVAGVIIAIHLPVLDTADPKHWVNLLILFVCAILIRGLMFLVLYLPLKWTGYGMNYEKAMIATWGGLRGALGIALALMVQRDPAILEVPTLPSHPFSY